MRRNWIKTGMATGLLTVGALPAEILYEKDGIALEGTVRLVGRNAATCQVLEENETPETYEATKANHGRPLHVWRLDYGAFNGSGQPLSQLAAHFRIEAEWPPCTNWTGLGQYPGPVQWSGSFETLQRMGGLEVGGEARETLYLLSIDGLQPRFRNWQLDYRFGETGAPSQPGPAPAKPVLPEPLCAGLEFGDSCWLELANSPKCYIWREFYIPSDTVDWNGGCSDGLASGSGTLKRSWTWEVGGLGWIESEGLVRAGKQEGRWAYRDWDGLTGQGAYVESKRDGRWVEVLGSGQVIEGPYVDDKKHGDWLVHEKNGRTWIAKYRHGERVD